MRQVACGQPSRQVARGPSVVAVTTTAPPPAGPDVEQLLDAAEHALEQVYATLHDGSVVLAENRVRALSRRLDRLQRRATTAAVAHAGRFRQFEDARRRGVATIATNLSRSAGCPKPDAYRRLNAAELDGTASGQAMWDLQITVEQALAIAGACSKFSESLPAETIARVEAEHIASAGTTSATTLQKDLASALSKLVPDDGEKRDRHQRRQRSARLGRQGPDGMSDVTMTVPPQGRALFEDAAATASRLRARRAEEARKAGEEPAEETYEQALHDHLMDLFSRGYAGMARAARDARTTEENVSACQDHGPCEETTTPRPGCGSCPSTDDDPPVGSIVVRLGPTDLTNPGAFVSTNSGAMVSVRDALEMARQGPHFLVAETDDGLRVFRIDEIDPDRGGHSRRFATAIQRLVLFALHDGCCFPGCREPATRCQVHHIDPWRDDGATAIDNMALVCRAHHNSINDSADGWTMWNEPGRPGAVHWAPNRPARGSPP